jgi:hypothetical protein
MHIILKSLFQQWMTLESCQMKDGKESGRESNVQEGGAEVHNGNPKQVT